MIGDIQIHKRIRAILRFQKLITGTDTFTSHSILKLFLPLFTSMVELETDSSLLHEIAVTIGLLTKFMNWSNYHRTLKRYLVLLAKTEERDRIILKIICEITEHFHYEDNEAKDKIETILLTEIIPGLKKQLKDTKTGQSVRINVAISIVKLIKKLPTEIQEEQLPTIITQVCGSLQSREQAVRDTTRQSLLQIAIYLGPKYFYFIVSELKGRLSR
jgi:U3 small nucleolar RNA-associated protein 20